jgi:tetratricopeptide (TPR) repeat protein
MEYLEEAITYYRQALALLPHGHTNRSSSLNILARVVFTRFEQLGRMEDLEEAIACHRQALALLPPSWPYQSFIFSLDFSNLSWTVWLISLHLRRRCLVICVTGRIYQHSDLCY